MSLLDSVWADFNEQRVSDAVRDVSIVASNTDSLQVRSKYFVDWAGLARLTKLRRLSIGPVTPEGLSRVAERVDLEALWLWDLRSENVDALAGLRNLRDLVIRNASRLQNLSGISGLAGLQTLWLMDLPLLPTFDDLSGLDNLRELKFETAPSRDARGPQRFPSLAPLSGLKQLERLHLVGIAAADGSLQPIAALRHLRSIHLPNTFTLAEFARLASALPDARGNFAEPVWEMGPVSCRKCGGGKVMLLGYGKRLACPTCDADRVATHVAEYERLRAVG